MKATTTAKQTQESPADSSYAVTPHDTNEIGTFLPRAIYTGSGGAIAMMLEGDIAAITWTDVPAGAILPLKARIILATGTTATGIIALY